MIALNSPVKPNLNHLNNLLEKINGNGWYTNFGPIQQELTERLEEFLGVSNLLLTNNGTTALQVAGRAIGSKSILTTPFSFVATTSAFKWQGDDVSFSDINSETLNICTGSILKALDSGCKSDTLVATHVYGNPCNVKEIDSISNNKEVKVIYDAAHAFGVKLAGTSILNFGDASTLSFHATKVFHTIEGGAIVFKNPEDLKKAREIINFGISPGKGVVRVGINAKLNEYQAAVGLVNLLEIDNILNYRAELFDLYREGLKSIVDLPLWHEESTKNGAYMPILLPDSKKLKLVKETLDKNNIQSRHYFEPSLDTIFFDSKHYGTKNSHMAAERVLCLPMHAHLEKSDITKVISKIKSVI
ncbi:DegT/DnrJ/EryC1/StrS family aminotransferase [Vibrio sp. ECSMB14106]|uniref:DegT/DnrJ/EryC1/StrS family aminotransferase n=1 Tax=Vibrio sp. ECSMB14106 TaxID=1638949 RepID=UPI000619A4D0|nr:DegT/DnrJ/EryC1/StrS family aminotransferase [Vibrio sp. ECSMB14106]